MSAEKCGSRPTKQRAEFAHAHFARFTVVATRHFFKCTELNLLNPHIRIEKLRSKYLGMRNSLANVMP
jgi:hypothetical protein